MILLTDFWDFIRYGIPRFFRNLWMFRKDLYSYRWYSGHYAILPFMTTALKDISKSVELYGIEEQVSSAKKVAKMKRAVELMQHFINDDFCNLAEMEVGALHIRKLDFIPTGDGYYRMVDNLTAEESEHNSKVYKRSSEIEEELWIELWDTIKGQPIQEYQKYYDNCKNKDNAWNEWFDGSGMRGWWD